MALLRWAPFTSLSALQERINKMFEEAFPQARSDDERLAAKTWKPSADIYETDTSLVITAELPGVNKEDISVEIKDDWLTIKGSRCSDLEEAQRKYCCRERMFGTFQRTFRLLEAVHPDKIKAKFKDGILEIEIPKSDKEKPKQIKVSSE